MNRKFYFVLSCAALGVIFIILFLNKGSSVHSNKLEVAGWSITSPAGWDIWKEDALEAVVMSPSHTKYNLESNPQAIFVYFNPKPWPHLNINDAFEELKQKPENSEIEILELNRRKWLTNKTTIDNITRYFARTTAGTKQYYNIRADGPETKTYLLEVLANLKVPPEQNR